jgi:hypothetical protein
MIFHSKNFDMKTRYLPALLLSSIISIVFCSCQKEVTTRQFEQNSVTTNRNSQDGHLKQTKEYSSEVVLKWIDMQLRLFRTNATPIGGLPRQRYYGYSAIALYESVLPGMPAYQTLSGQLTDMPAMPQIMPGMSLADLRERGHGCNE